MLFTNRIFRCNVINKHFRGSQPVHYMCLYNFQYNIMEKYGYFYKMSNNKNIYNGLNTAKDNSDIFIKDWTRETPQSHFQTFANLIKYCIENDQSLCDQKFDNFIDSFTDNVRHATEYELKTFFFLLAKFSDTISLRTRNYAEICAALDEECLDRINTMTFDDKMTYISLFYNCNICRQSDFCFKCLMNFLHKGKTLTKVQLIQFMFYIGFVKHIPDHVNIHTFESCLEDFFTELDTNELAIITMGLYNNKAPICSEDLMNMIIDKIIENCDDIHELSLGALIKIINYSIKNKSYFDNKIYQLFDCLQFQVPKLSISTNICIATLAATTRIVHETCLMNIAVLVFNQISSASLKDLSMLLQAFGVLNISPPIKECFFTNILSETKKNNTGENVIPKWGRSLASCVAHLGLIEIYPQGLMKYVLSKEFLENVYGTHYKKYGPDVLTIHNLSKIFYKELNISSLLDKDVQKLSYMCLKHQYPSKYVDKNFLNIKNTLVNMRGGNSYVTEKHILTHDIHGSKYLIVCDDDKGIPLPVINGYAAYKLGMIYYPPDNNIWIVLIVARMTHYIKNSDRFTGDIVAKKRELIKLGYYAAIIRTDVYKKCKNNDEKVQYLNSIIKDAYTPK